MNPKPGDEIQMTGEEKAKASALDTKLMLAQKLIGRLKDELAGLERLLTSSEDADSLEELARASQPAEGDAIGPLQEGKVVEGVFDGQNMVGSDGRQYSVPPNYASKSKLVEGDILKLTIQHNGTFIYKQIGPIERQRAVGTLTKDEMTGDWKVQAIGKKYSVLPAAVSYFKGDAGDDAVILIPKATPSRWAALENIVKRS